MVRMEFLGEGLCNATKRKMVILHSRCVIDSEVLVCYNYITELDVLLVS